MKNIYIIILFSTVFLSVKAQNQDPRQEKIQVIEKKIQNYIDENLTALKLLNENFQFSEEKNISLEVEKIKTAIKKDRLRVKLFQENPKYLSYYRAKEVNTKQAGCVNGDFENGFTNYNFYSRINWNHPGGDNVILGNTIDTSVFTPFIPPNTNAVITNVGFDPTLQPLGVNLPTVFNGNHSLRLNRINNGPEEATIMTRDFIISQPILSLNFAILFDNPDHPINENPFVRFEVFDNDINTIVDSKVITSLNSGSCLIDVDSNGWHHWKYSPWSCLGLDVSQSMNHNVTLRIIVSDCTHTAHATILYLDDICNNNDSCDSLFGNIILEPQGLICPTEAFTVCGSFENPKCTNGNPDITLNIFSLGQVLINTLTNPSINLSNNTFCFSVDPSVFGIDPNVFEFSANAYYINHFTGVETIVTDNSANVGPDVSFLGCDDGCDGINNFEINGSILSWESIDDFFELEFYSDGTSSCCYNEGANFPISVSYTINTNSFDFYTAITDLQRKCSRFRIKSNCSNWSDWCCIRVKPHTDNYEITNDCIPTEDCENYEDLIELISPNDDVLTGMLNFDVFVNIIASNTIENAANSNFKATNSIVLTQGFHAKNSSIFRAYIDECISITDGAIIEEKTIVENSILTEFIKIYPNPTKTRLTIESKNEVNSWLITNSYGRTFFTGNTTKTIDMTNLPKGIYFLKAVLKDGNVVMKKIIKN